MVAAAGIAEHGDEQACRPFQEVSDRCALISNAGRVREVTRHRSSRSSTGFALGAGEEDPPCGEDVPGLWPLGDQRRLGRGAGVRDPAYGPPRHRRPWGTLRGSRVRSCARGGEVVLAGAVYEGGARLVPYVTAASLLLSCRRGLDGWKPHAAGSARRHAWPRRGGANGSGNARSRGARTPPRAAAGRPRRRNLAGSRRSVERFQPGTSLA